MTTKIAISLPTKLAKQIETLRKVTGETRSGFIRRAIEGHLRQLENASRVAEYVEGYGRRPETAEEIEAAEAAAIDLLSQEPWE